MAKKKANKKAKEGDQPFLCKVVDCPTPLAFNPTIVSAKDSGDAQVKFFAKNGISATSHKVVIEPAPPGFEPLDDGTSAEPADDPELVESLAEIQKVELGPTEEESLESSDSEVEEVSEKKD